MASQYPQHPVWRSSTDKSQGTLKANSLFDCFELVSHNPSSFPIYAQEELVNSYSLYPFLVPLLILKTKQSSYTEKVWCLSHILSWMRTPLYLFLLYSWYCTSLTSQHGGQSENHVWWSKLREGNVNIFTYTFPLFSGLILSINYKLHWAALHRLLCPLLMLPNSKGVFFLFVLDML